MEKYLLFMFCLIICDKLSAQDIIFTKDSNRIQAKVIEIGEESVKYKDYSCQNGTTYIIKIDKIASITYENEKVDLFSDDNIVGIDSINFNGLERMNNVQMLNSPQADTDYFELYKKYHKGDHLHSSGVASLVLGLASTMGGVALFSFRAYQSKFSRVLGYPLIFVGQALVIASIPIQIIGKTRKNRAKNDLIEKDNMVYHPRIRSSLNVNINTNGIGFTLNF